MTIHHFTLIVEGADLQAQEHIDALFDAGCDDATAGRIGTTQYMDFDREAETLADAIIEATKAIEAAVAGARVVYVEPDDLVNMAEIAGRTGRTRESVRLLIKGDRGPGGFPAPATHFKHRNRMWRWHDVVAWFSDALDETLVDADPEASEFLAAFNAGLKLREAETKLDAAQRSRIRALVG